MTDGFTERPCDHCGRMVESFGEAQRVGDNIVHRRCASSFVDQTPAIELMPYTCNECDRSFWTWQGLELHQDRDACVVP